MTTGKDASHEPSVPFRPVQYLGSKLRVLDAIRDATVNLTEPGSTVVDLFTGTTVVAQALAHAGHHVVAVDSQHYAQTFGRALLGVGRSEGESFDAGPLIGVTEDPRRRADGPWAEAEVLEQAMIGARDAAGLRRLYRRLPLIWRDGASWSAPGMMNVYSGSYFGVRQGREIDDLRWSIRSAAAQGRLSQWQEAVALTALMHSASAAVHSAGKHFAQPMQQGAGTPFLDTRLLNDRMESISERFVSACLQTSTVARKGSERHEAVRSLAEDHVASTVESRRLYYLDPPYTAQQYSRFYHILETIAVDGSPKIQQGQKSTTGLYPDDRFKSAFSSRRRAKPAMEAIIEMIARRGSAALISYSSSETGSDGNARMITLEELLTICTRAFGGSRVDYVRMPHRYRQFNKSGNANQDREDPELMILCKAI